MLKDMTQVIVIKFIQTNPYSILYSWSCEEWLVQLVPNRGNKLKVWNVYNRKQFKKSGNEQPTFWSMNNQWEHSLINTKLNEKMYLRVNSCFQLSNFVLNCFDIYDNHTSRIKKLADMSVCLQEVFW